MTTHGEQRLGLLTSSKAKIIMHGSQRAWDSLRKELWAGEAADFDDKTTTGARAYGHEHEAEGAAKFWERHPEYELRKGGFHLWHQPGHPLHGWLGSSPDRLLLNALMEPRGLEIKSPTTEHNLGHHLLDKHLDQCQHGLLVTGLPLWWLVVHHGDKYQEWRITPNPAWQAEYLKRALAFHRFCYEGVPVKRRRLSATDL